MILLENRYCDARATPYMHTATQVKYNCAYAVALDIVAIDEPGIAESIAPSFTPKHANCLAINSQRLPMFVASPGGLYNDDQMGNPGPVI